MPNNRPSNKSQDITDDCWYYEEKNAIEVIMRVTSYDGRRQHAHIKIPHRKLLATLRRVGKVK